MLTTSYQDCVVNTLNWYRQEASKTDLVCTNEQYYLLRDGYHTCWRQADCDAFIDAAVKFWNGSQRIGLTGIRGSDDEELSQRTWRKHTGF